MDTGQQHAQLQRRLAEVEPNNQRLRADKSASESASSQLTERLAQYEPRYARKRRLPPRKCVPRTTASKVMPSGGASGSDGGRKSPGRRPTVFKFNDAGAQPGECTLPTPPSSTWADGLEDRQRTLFFVGFRVGVDRATGRLGSIPVEMPYGLRPV